MIWLDTREGEVLNANLIITMHVIKSGSLYLVRATTPRGTYHLVIGNSNWWKTMGEAMAAIRELREELNESS